MHGVIAFPAPAETSKAWDAEQYLDDVVADLGAAFARTMDKFIAALVKKQAARDRRLEAKGKDLHPEEAVKLAKVTARAGRFARAARDLSEVGGAELSRFFDECHHLEHISSHADDLLIIMSETAKELQPMLNKLKGMRHLTRSYPADVEKRAGRIKAEAEKMGK